jgi:hypothetical protein
MLTFKQWQTSKRKNITQEQRAQIPNRSGALDIVQRMIEDALAQNYSVQDGLLEEDLDRIFNSQPVHFDEGGYVPHWFLKVEIRSWGLQLCEHLHPTKRVSLAQTPDTRLS